MNKETLAVMRGPRGYILSTHEEHMRQIHLAILEELMTIRETLDFMHGPKKEGKP